MGGASLLEKWILEGDEQGNFPVNAFVFLSIVFALNFFGAKFWMNDRVNVLLSIQKFFPRKKIIRSLNEILVGSSWWMQLCRIGMIQFWSSVRIMREHSQISFKHYSFIVIIVCFYSYKLLIRCPFCMNINMSYIFEGVVVSLWSSFDFVFLYEVEFLLSCWLRQCWSIWHVNILYFSFLFRKDWLILNQTKCSLTNKIFDEQMCTQAKHMSLTVSIKFINGKIWVFTPL